MNYGLEGKRAVVLAATSGLGFAVAEQLVQEGCSVAICGRNLDRLDIALERLRSIGGTGTVTGMCTDVSSAEEINAFFEHARQSMGDIDILVTNAGGPSAGGFDDFDDEQWHAAFNLTCMSAVRSVRQALPDMKKNGWGRIIAITSVAVKQPIPNLILSNAIRAGLTGCMKTLAAEVAAKGITVNCLCPGYTHTERIESLAEQMAHKEGCLPDDIIARWSAMIPAGRLATPQEFASLACYLCSVQAAAITGASFQVDGGLYKGLL